MALPETFVEGWHNADVVRKMKYDPLGNTGMVVSQLSFGASSLGSVFHETNLEESVAVVEEVLKSGINLIDTAPWYGHGKAETVLGKALKNMPRKAYYLTTKIGRYLPEVDKQFDFSAERTIQSVNESLDRMGLTYVDVIQVHDMEFAPNLDVIVNETLPALQKVKESGKARFIGITGYPMGNFMKVLERSTVKIDTILTYCHGSMNDNSLQEYISDFDARGVGVINASPVSMGLLSNRGPPSWHPATQDIKDQCRKAVDYCQERNVDISRLALHFTLNQPGIPTTLVSSSRLVNIKQNIESVYTDLTELETEVLNEVIKKFMKPLNNKNWEGVELAEYRRQLQGKEGTLIR